MRFRVGALANVVNSSSSRFRNTTFPDQDEDSVCPNPAAHAVEYVPCPSSRKDEAKEESRNGDGQDGEKEQREERERQ